MGLFKRGDYYYMKFQMRGVSIYESCKTSNKKLAEMIMLKKREEILLNKSNIKQIKDITFNVLSEKYLSFISGKLKSIRRIKSMLKILNFYFADKLLSNIEIQDIEKLQNDYLKSNHTINYTNNLIRILKVMYSKAYDYQLIDETTLLKIRKIKLLRGGNERIRFLSQQEYESLLSVCKEPLKSIIILASNTGMRKGEILNLKWSQVDLTNRLIMLDSSTKSRKKREIPLNDYAYLVLSKTKKHKNEYVFINPESNKPFTDLKKSFGTAIKKSGLVDFHFHDLRHSFASNLILNNVNVATIKELLGHSDLRTTMKYSHINDNQLKQAVNSLTTVAKSLQ
jgi:integrase